MNYRGTATDAPKSSKCLDCLPLWDRKGNVKAVQLCPLHKAAPDLLAACLELEEVMTKANDLGDEYEWDPIGEAKRLRAAILKATEGR